jgi:hypothetical protein
LGLLFLTLCVARLRHGFRLFVSTQSCRRGSKGPQQSIIYKPFLSPMFIGERATLLQMEWKKKK